MENKIFNQKRIIESLITIYAGIQKDSTDNIEAEIASAFDEVILRSNLYGAIKEINCINTFNGLDSAFTYALESNESERSRILGKIILENMDKFKINM